MTKIRVMEVEKLRKIAQVSGHYGTDLENFSLKMRP